MEALQPLADRIVANPVAFTPARNKEQSNGEDMARYVVIGNAHDAALISKGAANAEMDSGSLLGQTASTPKKTQSAGARRPQSVAEALAMYTKPQQQSAASKEDLSDAEFNDSSSSSSGQNGSEEVFHEAREFVPTGADNFDSDSDDDDAPKEYHGPSLEDIGQTLEDVGRVLDGDEEEDELESSVPDEKSESEMSDEEDDEDYELDNDNESEIQDDDDRQDVRNVDGSDAAEMTEKSSENEDDMELDVSDSERVELQREAAENAQENEDEEDETQSEEGAEIKTVKVNGDHQETKVEQHDEEEELKHKTRSSNVTEDDSGDLSRFHLFNEFANDVGTNPDSRIVKSWGPVLSELKPCGLLNHGVTCYTNAAVQSMVHIPAIQHYLFDILRGKYKSTIKNDSISYILAETSKKMWWNSKDKKRRSDPASANLTYINPKKLISRLDDINCMMSEWQQEDSHEYFMSLMSRLQEDSVPKGRKMTESIIYDIFGGILNQTVTCKSCGGISKTEQPFYDLSLHLKGRKKKNLDEQQLSNGDNNQTPKTDKNSSLQQQSQDSSVNEEPLGVQNRLTIEKSIKDFFNPELIKVDKEKKGYVCEKCNQTTNAVKRNSVLKAPETLLVHLKKFRFNGQSSSKMKQAVSYPMFLDLTEFYDTERSKEIKKDSGLKYQLISVVVHEGRSLSSGHYISYCKQPDGSWVIYDDEYINKISERNVLKEPNAYYLIYSRLTSKSLPTKNKKTVIKNLSIPQTTSSPNSSHSSPKFNRTSKRKNGNKNKKRRFNKY